MLILDALIVILAILIGSRKGGATVGFTGGVGLAVLIFVCGLKPTSPPITVMLIILAVTSLAGILQCSGGLDYLVSIAEKILRKNPNHVTVLAPLVVLCFVIFTGTAFIAMALIPVIAEVSRGANVRPERPLSATCAASAFGIAASPMSAATAGMIGILGTQGINFGPMMMVLIPAILIGVLAGSLCVYKRGKELLEDPEYLRRLKAGGMIGILGTQGINFGPMMMVLIPAILIGVLAGSLCVYKRGKELLEDPEYLRRLKAGEIAPLKAGTNYVPTREAKLAVGIFGSAVALILLLGSFKGLLPHWTVNGKSIALSTVNLIEVVTLAASALIIFACKIKPANLTKSSVFNGGVIAVMVVFGVCFMTDTFFAAHKGELISLFGDVLRTYPWLFAVVLVLGSAILESQGATTAALMPLGVALGIDPHYLVAMAPAVCCTWFLPIHPNILASVAIDSTGTMNVGSWILNHSTMLPGLVVTVVSVIFGFVFAGIVF